MGPTYASHNSRRLAYLEASCILTVYPKLRGRCVPKEGQSWHDAQMRRKHRLLTFDLPSSRHFYVSSGSASVECDRVVGPPDVHHSAAPYDERCERLVYNDPSLPCYRKTSSRSSLLLLRRRSTIPCAAPALVGGGDVQHKAIITLRDVSSPRAEDLHGAFACCLSRFQ